MRHMLWNTFVVASVLLIILTVAEWARTDQDYWWISFGTPNSYWEACSSAGHLRFARATGFSHSMGWQVHVFSRDSTMPRFSYGFTPNMHGAPGFRFASGGFAYGRFSAIRYSILDVAFWGLLLIFSLMPGGTFFLTTFRLRRLTQRLSQIQCAVCGYDLRATQGRCPECGTVPNQSSKASIARGKPA